MTTDPLASDTDCGAREARELPLREYKRLATLAAIEDAATALVDERGFDAVTVEDVCARATVSKRTFFNYVDSKESAVVGPVPKTLDADALERFRRDAASDLVGSTLRLLLDCVRAARVGDSLHSGTVMLRRKRIFRAEPELAGARIAAFVPFHALLRGEVREVLVSHPGLRGLPQLSVEVEARAVVSLVFTSYSVGTTSWAEGDDSSADGLDAACVDALDSVDVLLTHHRPRRTPAGRTDVPTTAEDSMRTTE